MNRAMPMTSIVLIALLVHLAGCKETPHPRDLTGEARAEVSRSGRHIKELDEQGDSAGAEKEYRAMLAVFQREQGAEHPLL